MFCPDSGTVCFVWFSGKKKRTAAFSLKTITVCFFDGRVVFFSIEFETGFLCCLDEYHIIYSKVSVKHTKQGTNEWNLTTKGLIKEKIMWQKRMKNAIPATEQSALTTTLCEKCTTNCLTPCWKSISCHRSCYRANDMHIQNVRNDTILSAACFGGRPSFSWTHNSRNLLYRAISYIIVYVLCV